MEETAQQTSQAESDQAAIDSLMQSCNDAEQLAKSYSGTRGSWSNCLSSCWLVGMPSLSADLAKTLLISTLADCMHLGFRRSVTGFGTSDILGSEVLQDDQKRANADSNS